MMRSLPALAICGWSGSGKTALLEGLVRRLRSAGLRVAVVKHDVHGVRLDPAETDTSRLSEAGAAVLLVHQREVFQRTPREGPLSMDGLLADLQQRYDVILCEGFKSLPFERKVWLRRWVGDDPPPGEQNFDLSLDPEEDRVSLVEQLLQEWLRVRRRSMPVYAGVLIGGASRRMGLPKQLLPTGSQAWVERIVSILQTRVRQVVLLGSGVTPSSLDAVPRLPDVADKAGPLAGMLAAMRWRPDAAWVFAACDLPLLEPAAVDWLLAQRRPGVWAILPRLADRDSAEPLFAVYEPQARGLLEEVTAPVQIVGRFGVHCPCVPPSLAAAWLDADTPEAAERLRGMAES